MAGLLPIYPPTQPLCRFIFCVYGTQRIISVVGQLSILIILTQLMDRSLGNLGNDLLAPSACPYQALAPFPPLSPLRSHIMGFGVEVSFEGNSNGGGEAVTILGTHLLALLQGWLV